MSFPLVHNVSSFLRPDERIRVEHRDRDQDEWPIHVAIGNAGGIIDLYADVATATRLRDALTAALGEDHA